MTAPTEGTVTSLAATRRRRNGWRIRRFLVVVAHPIDESFVASLARTTVRALTDSGHHVDVIDLYAEDFDGRLSIEEWRDIEHGGQWPQIAGHVAKLRAADGLVFVYPTWFGGQPAILKGWFDRVWAHGVAYQRRPNGRPIRGLLHHVRSIDVVTTHGSGKFMNSLQGEPGKRVILRGLRALCGVRCRGRWHAFYGNDHAADADRRAFIRSVHRAMTSK
jgi:NAD(P)H dehydrogenase (quinone)